MVTVCLSRISNGASPQHGHDTRHDTRDGLIILWGYTFCGVELMNLTTRLHSSLNFDIGSLMILGGHLYVPGGLGLQTHRPARTGAESASPDKRGSTRNSVVHTSAQQGSSCGGCCWHGAEKGTEHPSFIHPCALTCKSHHPPPLPSHRCYLWTCAVIDWPT